MSYNQSLQLALNTQILVPITLDCRYLQQAIENVVDTSINEEILINQTIFDETNIRSINLLVETIKQLRKMLSIGWPLSKTYIEKSILRFIENEVLKWTEPAFIMNRIQDTMIQIKQIYLKIQENAFELCDTLVSELCDDYLNSQFIIQLLNDILDSQYKRIAFDLFEFAYLDNNISKPLLDEIMRLLGDIIQDFFNYLIEVAIYANCKMSELDLLLKKYSSLANQDNYQYMQKEVSTDIIQNSEQILLGKSFNRNSNELHQITKAVIRHFYYIFDECKYYFKAKIYDNFDELLNDSQFNIIKPLPQNIQLIENIDNDIHLIELGHQINVIKCIKVQKKLNEKETINGYKIQIQFNNNIEEYIVNLEYHYLMFHKHHNKWIQFEQEQQINISLIQFINENFEYLHCGHPEFKKRIQSEKSLDKATEDTQGFKNAVFKFKKISAPKKPIRYGTRMRLVGAKALGIGLGCLIVDCLDENISWDDKLKNAGYTAVSFGILGFLASRLPVIGMIIQQVILVFALKTILDNKVISDLQTAKNLTHLGMMVSIGIGMTLTGSLLFPIAFWGAFFGGFLGGIGIGVYQKYMIPYFMNNLLNMMNNASQLIRRNGMVRFKQFGIRKLKIDEKFVIKNKPQELTLDDFFTMLMFCLSNEVRLISCVSYVKQLEKIKENNKADLLQRQCEIEVQLKIWKTCAQYLKKNNLSLIKYAPILSQFVEGMLVNYKIE